MARNNPLYIDDVLKLLDPARRELEPEVGSRGFAEAEVRGIDVDRRQVTALVSTPNVDRYGEIVEPEAFRESLPMFMRNPVLIAGHRYSTEAGSCPVIGKWLSMQITKEGLIGTCEFMTDDELAESWWKRFVQKCIRAFSVGFIAQQSTLRKFELPDGSSRVLRVFTKVELIEVSAVTIPANRESLVIGASAGRRDRDADERRPDIVSLSNRQLSIATRQLKEPIRQMVREALRESLDAGPYGALAAMVEQTVRSTLEIQAMQRAGGVDDDENDPLNYDATGAYIGRSHKSDDDDDPELAELLDTLLAGSDGS